MIQEDIVKILVEQTMWLSIVFLAGFLILSYILTVKSKSVQAFAGRFPQVYMILILIFLALLANVFFNVWLPLINGG